MKPLLSVVACSVLLLLGGCASSIKGDSQPSVMHAKGPNILNARSEPEVVILNRDLQPLLPVEVLADVKDFKYPVTSVQVKFQALPLVIEMERVAGSTWRAEFTPQQLQVLAVSGKTVTYKADIVATNTKGDTTTSPDPLNVYINAPEMNPGIS
jgi:homogentisate 1,2-dioxygenase